MDKDSAKGSVNETIKICVGGQDFKTTWGTLLSDQKSMLAHRCFVSLNLCNSSFFN